MNTIQIKRIYEERLPSDGYRILVDRLWPRGLTKEKAYIDEWNKNIAPSAELRKWFHHQPEEFEQFSKLYKQELSTHEQELKRLKEIAGNQPLTLLYAARDTQVNHARVLEEVLKGIK